MRRDLNRWAENGSEVLDKYKNYDLSHGEVVEAMSKCETGEPISTAFNCLIHGLYIGIEIGRHIERNRQRSKAK